MDLPEYGDLVSLDIALHEPLRMTEQVDGNLLLDAPLSYLGPGGFPRFEHTYSLPFPVEFKR